MLLVNISHGLLAMYLLTLLAVPKVQTPLVAILCLLCLFAGQWRQPPAVGQRLRAGWAMAVPLAGYGALFAIQILAGWLRWRDWDQVLICSLGMGVLLSTLPGRGTAPHRWLLPAAALGAIGALALAGWQYFYLGVPRPPGHLGAGPVGNGALKYGDLSAVLALFSLQMMLCGPVRWRRVLGGLGFAAGLGAVALTQARGALLGVLLALAVLGLLWILRRRGRAAASVRRPARQGRSTRLKLALVAVLGVAVLAGPARYMGARFADIGPQFERFEAGDTYSEVGQRLTLWGIALRAARHAPLTGVGFDGFGAETQRQRDSGELNPKVIVLYESPHNEYLAGLSSAGIPGLLVIVLFFWAPLVVGCRRFLRGQRPEESLMLVLVSASYAAFTMTDSLLDRQISLLAWILLASWLMSASRDPRPQAAGADRAPAGGTSGHDRALADGASGHDRALANGAAGHDRAPAGRMAMQGRAGARDMTGHASGMMGASGVTDHVKDSSGAGTAAARMADGMDDAPREAAHPAIGASGGRTDGLSVPGGLSVAIITRDEAHRIARCLESVAFADQIVVLDSGSTDDTVAIARRLGAEVEVTPDWPGFGVQKNRALDRCRHRWVLSLDADEQVSDGLAAEILQALREAAPEWGARGASESTVAGVANTTGTPGASGARGATGTTGTTGTTGVSGGTSVAGEEGAAGAAGAPDVPEIAGWWLRRSSRYCGQVIRHGLWGNDRVLRLFARERGRFTNDRVHEHLVCEGPTRVLGGSLVHDSVDSPEDARSKARHYAFLGAESLRNRGRGGTLRGVRHAAWSFLRGYLLRAGFLDGRYGLTLACLNASGTFWKYHWASLPDERWQNLQKSFS
ncbi:glycosyltransferase [Lautropia dentalis]|uniref:Glycosyltransferase n=1 Tax=Lautropia dentalis TaxID=2490857 RepID=A0A3R8MTR1_9BURK|nr:glycosyltransferase [Lautropia dentalis]